MSKIERLTDNIKQWGADRLITKNGRPMSQAIKTMEETTELLDGINRSNKKDTMDAIGDIYVTLVMVSETLNVSIEECIEMAYEEIKNRTGYLREDGTFIKDTNCKVVIK